MKIERIELREISTKLRFRFQTSFGEEQHLRKLLVTVFSDDIEGYGECTGHNFPGYSYETVDTAWFTLKDNIVPVVLGKDYETADQLLHDLSYIRGHNMAVAALESAFWDLKAKALGVPLWTLLGGRNMSIPVGASLGIQASAEETVELAQRHMEQGYQRLKFKIKPGWDVVPLRAVREALPDMALTVDANSAYGLTDARVFQELDELGLDYIEQPLAYDDLVDHAQLQSQLKTAICLDESIHSAEDARKGLQLGSGRVINLKMGRVRGHRRSLRVHDVALAFGAPLWCGGMLETAIGRAHNLHLSSLEGFVLPGDTSSASRYWEKDISHEWLDAKDGFQSVPQGSGIGITLDNDFLQKVTVRKETF